MSELKKSPPISKYLPACLKQNTSGWVIEYYALEPQKNILQRKQVRIKRVVSRYRNKRDAREHALEICETINQKLRGGWSPFFVGDNARLYVPLPEVLHKFVAESVRDKRSATLRTYKSFATILERWSVKNCKNIYCSLFSRLLAIQFLDAAYSSGVSARTYNNYIKQGRLFFNWAKEKCYCKENPFDNIKLKQKPQKTRTIIPPEVRDTVKNYLTKDNPNFLCVCELVYFALIRPNEIKNLRVGDINFEGKFITVSGEFAKNHKTRHAALNDDLIERLAVMKRDVPKDYYIFGWGCQPSKTKIPDNSFTKLWAKTRKHLALPQAMQLYSFRDTGIYEMLKSGVDDLTVMQHADHSSLDITTIYANHADAALVEKVRAAKVMF